MVSWGTGTQQKTVSWPPIIHPSLVGSDSMWPILGPRTSHAGVKPNPYTWGSRNHPMAKGHMPGPLGGIQKSPNGKEPHGGNPSESWDPGVSSHMWGRGLFVALELVGANFNSGPSKVNCRVLIIDFVSLLFFKGEGHAWFPIAFRQCPTKLWQIAVVCAQREQNLLFLHLQITPSKQVSLEEPSSPSPHNPSKLVDCPLQLLKWRKTK